jgi:hypothetical protein
MEQVASSACHSKEQRDEKSAFNFGCVSMTDQMHIFALD